MMTPEEITQSRMKRFNKFYASLSVIEQADVDCKLSRWVSEIKSVRPKSNFGLVSAKELFMALIDYQEMVDKRKVRA